MRFIVCC